LIHKVKNIMGSTKVKLFVLIALVGAVGLVTATGAFGTLIASRTAEVSVTGDDAALLALQAASGPGGNYIEGTNEIAINLTNVNTNATSEFPNALNITNNGNQDVAVSISVSGANPGAIAFAVQGSQLDESGGTATADLTWPETQAYRIDGSGKPIDLKPGDTIQVGFYIDTADGDASNGFTPGASGVIGANTEIINNVEISASASEVDSGTTDSSDGNLEAA
jgi:hypothetical protein